jgi:hypothetical protein
MSHRRFDEAVLFAAREIAARKGPEAPALLEEQLT